MGHKLLAAAALTAMLVLAACTVQPGQAPETAETPPPTQESPTQESPAQATEPEQEPDQETEIETPSPTAEAAPESIQTTFVLPDGMQCRFAGTGATLAFEDKRLSYTCGEPEVDRTIGLLGEPEPAGPTEWQTEVATIVSEENGFALEASQVMTFTAWELTLASGARCLHAGFGATLAFDEERLNYTCDFFGAGDSGPAEGDWIILGAPVNTGEGTWTATRGEIVEGDDGFELLNRETVAIAAINGVDPNTTAAESSVPDELLNTTWSWAYTEYGNDTRAEAAEPGQYTLFFHPDGRVNLRINCNRGMTTYTATGGSLSIDAIASTLMACPDDEVTPAFTRDLANVVSYVMDGENLALSMWADAGIMHFEPMDGEPMGE